MSPTPHPSDTYVTPSASISVATDGTVVVDADWLRALELRVHTLETALEEQSAALVDARAQLDDSRRRGGDLDRVRLVVEALQQRVSGDPEKESVLNRMEAALARLSPSPGLHRPALPTPVADTRAASAAPPPLTVALPEAIAPAPVAAPHPPPLGDLPTPPPAPAATPEPEAAQPGPVEPVPVEPVPEDAVLPVPAPPVPVASAARRRRWRLGGTA